MLLTPARLLGMSQELGKMPTTFAQFLQPCSAAHAQSHRKVELIDLKELQGLCGNDLLPIKAEVN